MPEDPELILLLRKFLIDGVPDTSGAVRIHPIRQTKFHRLVKHMQLGMLFNWLFHKYVAIVGGAAPPSLRNVHLRNGSGKPLKEIKVNRLTNPAVPPVPVPENLGDVLDGEWAFNDDFEGDGHIAQVKDLTLEVTESTIPLLQDGTTYRGEIAQAGDELFETLWIELRAAGDGIEAEVFIWGGSDTADVHELRSEVIHLNPV